MSSSNNSTNNCIEFHPEKSIIFDIEIGVQTWEAITLILVYVVVTIVSLIGNITIILVVIKHQTLRTGRNFFIISLAIADISMVILVLPFGLTYHIMGQWIFGSFMCKFWSISCVFCFTSSIFNMCAIALDRYWSASYPINYNCKRTIKHVNWMIALTWILSAIISSPLLYIHDFEADESEHLQCKPSNETSFIIYISSCTFYIPSFIMVIVYTRIFIVIRRQLRNQCGNNFKKEVKCKKKLQMSSKQEYKMCERVISMNSFRCSPQDEKDRIKRSSSLQILPSKTSCSSSILGSRILINESNVTNMSDNEATSFEDSIKTTTEFSESPIFANHIQKKKQKIWEQEERKAAITLGVILALFFIRWSPFYVLFVVRHFSDSFCVSRYTLRILISVGFVNSIWNPIVYLISNKEFRVGFKKLFNGAQNESCHRRGQYS